MTMVLNKKLTIALPILIVIIIAVVLTMMMQNQSKPNVDPNLNIVDTTEETNNESEDIEMTRVYLTVNNAKFEVEQEDNPSVRALAEKLKAGDVVVEAKEYGGFEKVGELGFSLPTNDEEMLSEHGDLMLYNGDQLTLHYGPNKWSYTKLGHIDVPIDELKQILGDGDVKIVLSLR